MARRSARPNPHRLEQEPGEAPRESRDPLHLICLKARPAAGCSNSPSVKVGETTMSKYLVTFFKRVADSNGHEIDAPQDAIEISCPNMRHAIETATRQFAEARHIPNWSLHADRIAITQMQAGS